MKKIDIDKLNDLIFSFVDNIKFPSQKILSLLPKNHSLFETVVVAANDKLVDSFLKKKIEFKVFVIKKKERR